MSGIASIRTLPHHNIARFVAHCRLPRSEDMCRDQQTNGIHKTKSRPALSSRAGNIIATSFAAA
jgi:hypothetical protein